MGFLDYFAKDADCKKCGTRYPKKSGGSLGYYKQAPKVEGWKWLCQECLQEALLAHFKLNTSQAIVIYPAKKKNAYVFYSFADYNKPENRDFINHQKSFLPGKNAKCRSCDHDAKYTLCTADYFENANPGQDESEAQSNPGRQFLCKDCLIEDFKKYLAENDSQFLNVILPESFSEGYFTTWKM